MKKLLIPIIFILSVLLSISIAKAQTPFFLDDFNRTDKAPWRTDFVSPCTTQTNYVDIYNHEWLRFHYTSGCIALTDIDLGTYANNFEMILPIWVSTHTNDVMVVEWADLTGKTVSIRFDRNAGKIEIGKRDIITDFTLNTTSDVRAAYPYNFSLSGTGLSWIITKINNSLNIYSDLTPPNDFNLTIIDPLNNVPLRDILLAVYNPSQSGTNDFDIIGVNYYGTMKILPTLKIDVSPAYNVTYGTTQTIGCHAINYTGVPLILYYYGNPILNPYTAILNQGTNYFECISNETDIYYSASAVALTFVTGIGATTTLPPPSQIPNASQPIPQFVNETEWREAGYGWALIFVSPIGLITIISLIIAAVIARYAGVTMGVIAFLFLWFILILFTGILPTWIFLVLVIIAGFIVVQLARGILSK